MVQVNLNQPPKFILLYYHVFQFEVGTFHYFSLLTFACYHLQILCFLKSTALK